MPDEAPGELKQRVRLIGSAVFAACLIAYLLPDATFGQIMLRDPTLPFTQLTRFAWSLLFALLAVGPLLVYQCWKIALPRIDSDERWLALAVAVIVAAPFYLAWFLGRVFWPQIETWLGVSPNFLVWLGFDTLSVQFKLTLLVAAVALLAAGMLFVDDREREMRETVAPVIAVIVLTPPYLAAFVLLLTVVAGGLWLYLPGLWKLALLLLPAAMARYQIAEGSWPWFAALLTVGILLAIPGASRQLKLPDEPPELESAPEEEQPLPAPPPPAPTGPFQPLFYGEPLVEEPADEEESDEEDEPEVPAPVADPVAVEQMLADLKSGAAEPNPEIACPAINALGRLGAEDQVPLLVSLLAPDGRASEVRVAAIQALGRLGGEEAVNALSGVLADPDLAVRWQAEETLDYLLAGGCLPTDRIRVRREKPPLVRVLN